MLLPYRAKNPPEHFPVVTLSLIALNTLVFLLTSEYFLVIRESVVQEFALSHATFSLLRLFAALFLHSSLFHLVGNMLFLWLFGASVEGRLRPAKYVLLYLLAGVAGSLLHEVIFGLAEPERFSLGASGAIMGLAGAYLYLFPYSTICVFWLFYFRAGVAEWQARWLVLFYIGFDIFYALLYRGADGVGHFAHLGGFGMGLFTAWLMRVRRDNEAISAAQAVQADVKDYTMLSLSDLDALLQHPTENMDIVMAYCEKYVKQYGGGGNFQPCLEMLNRYSRQLLERGDPQRLAYVLLYIPVSSGGLPLVCYLRLASKLEALVSNDLASQLYRRVYDLNPNASDTEMALFRLGQLMERAFQNPAYAQASYQELLRLFPNGQFSLEARRALQRTG